MPFSIASDFVAPTLGVEMEYQIVDAETRHLCSDTKVLLEEGAQLWGDHIKPEFHAPVVECITTPCDTVQEVVGQCAELRRTVMGLAMKRGRRVVSASTHPVTHWRDVQLTPNERYEQIQADLGDVARSNLIYGMHCHVGIADPDARIAVLNGARNFLPHLLALSCSSPFWQERDTGMSSVRTVVFQRFPRTGLPERFQTHSQFEDYVRTLVQTGCIDDAKKIWWDIRPHPHYPTIEFRVCDIPPRLRELGALAAFIQIMCTRMLNLYRHDLDYRNTRRAFLKENMFRAMRYGISGKIIDLKGKGEVSTRESIQRALEDWSQEVDDLRLHEEVGFIHEILEGGNSADRQRKIYEETGDLNCVVDHLIQETAEDL